MEARVFRPLGVATMWIVLTSFAQAQVIQSQPYVAHSKNFIVFASSPDWASQVAKVAEKHRSELSVYWLGKELPAWRERCPIHVHSGNLGAGGETRFSLLTPHPGAVSGVGNWAMSVQGTPERILDSVLPHEITHTIFATHFARYGKYVPRWADEGACTTVEHEAEKRKHRHFLTEFLQNGRGLAFNQMFRLKEYPQDILPLYAQGHSAVQFLIDQSSPQEFIHFLEEGMQTDAWNQALKHHYSYQSIGQFQTMWNKWLYDGSPTELIAYAPRLSTPGMSQSGQLQLASSQGSVQGASSVSSASTESSKTPGKVHIDIAAISPQTVPPDPTSLAGLESTAPSKQARTAGSSWYQRRLQEFGNSPGSTADRIDDTGKQVASSSTEIPRANPFREAAPSSESLSPNSHGSDSFARVSTPAFQPIGNRLEPIRSTDLSKLPSVTPAPTPKGAHQPVQSATRPQTRQSTQVQVIDWGQSKPIPGITSPSSSQADGGRVQLVPIRR